MLGALMDLDPTTFSFRASKSAPPPLGRVPESLLAELRLAGEDGAPLVARRFQATRASSLVEPNSTAPSWRSGGRFPKPEVRA